MFLCHFVLGLLHCALHQFCDWQEVEFDDGFSFVCVRVGCGFVLEKDVSLVLIDIMSKLVIPMVLRFHNTFDSSHEVGDTTRTAKHRQKAPLPACVSFEYQRDGSVLME